LRQRRLRRDIVLLAEVIQCEAQSESGPWRRFRWSSWRSRGRAADRGARPPPRAAAAARAVAGIRSVLTRPAARAPPAGRAGGGGGGGPIIGPLTVSSNPNYFQDPSGHALLLAGSHTWNNLQDWGADATLQTLDFDAYVAFLVKHGHNFTLLWRTELTKFCGL